VDRKYTPVVTLMFYTVMLLVTVPVRTRCFTRNTGISQLYAGASRLYETLKASVLIISVAC